MTQRIEAVVWDVGRVLVEWDLKALYARLIADRAQLDWFVTNVVTEQWHARHDAGADIHEMVAARSAEFPQHAALIAAYPDRFNETIPGPVPGTHALVEALAARGVPQYAITNFGAYVWPRFAVTQPVLTHFRDGLRALAVIGVLLYHADLLARIATHFRDVVVSGVERLVKPDPAIFRLAAARFGYNPAAMLFIDDNAANVAAARACGWHAHHFAGAEALAMEMQGLGLIA